jgi:hypothetical protein
MDNTVLIELSEKQARVLIEAINLFSVHTENEKYTLISTAVKLADFIEPNWRNN